MVEPEKMATFYLFVHVCCLFVRQNGSTLSTYIFNIFSIQLFRQNPSNVSNSINVVELYKELLRHLIRQSRRKVLKKNLVHKLGTVNSMQKSSTIISSLNNKVQKSSTKLYYKSSRSNNLVGQNLVQTSST